MAVMSQRTLSNAFSLSENIRLWIKISLKFVPKSPINDIAALVQIMGWCRPSDKPLSEPLMVTSPTHICVTRPQWVNNRKYFFTDCALRWNWDKQFCSLTYCSLVTPCGYTDSGQKLVQIMACCFTATSHYQIQIWLKVEWYPSKGNFTRDISARNHKS